MPHTVPLSIGTGVFSGLGCVWFDSAREYLFSRQSNASQCFCWPTECSSWQKGFVLAAQESSRSVQSGGCRQQLSVRV